MDWFSITILISALALQYSVGYWVGRRVALKGREVELSRTKEILRTYDIQAREMEMWLAQLGYDYINPKLRDPEDQPYYEDAVKWAKKLAQEEIDNP